MNWGIFQHFLDRVQQIVASAVKRLQSWLLLFDSQRTKSFYTCVYQNILLKIKKFVSKKWASTSSAITVVLKDISHFFKNKHDTFLGKISSLTTVYQKKYANKKDNKHNGINGIKRVIAIKSETIKAKAASAYQWLGNIKSLFSPGQQYLIRSWSRIETFLKTCVSLSQRFFHNLFSFIRHRYQDGRVAIKNWWQEVEWFPEWKSDGQTDQHLSLINQKQRKRLKQSLGKVFAPQFRSLYLSLIITAVILGSAWWFYQFVFAGLPAPTDLTNNQQIITTRILDRNGNLLYRIYKDENRTVVPLEQIPQDMIDATIAIEDKNFYQHHGFSVRGIFRALLNNVKEDELQGGSTLTQQLVKNRLLSNERTIRRKLRELILSVLVESTYSKDEILQMYLNEVPYGGSTYGVEEAAWRYFNKPAKDLTLGESAILAGLPAAPSVYTPFGPNPELSQRRRSEVLRRMVEDDYISLEAAYHAEQEELDLRQDVIDIKAPHFVMYVKKLLADKFGERALQQGGLEVRTSLDLNLQEQTEQVVKDQIEQIQHLRIKNGAALVTNPQTGEILAMVGSRDYFDFANDGQVNVTLRPRQPGSSIKPLTYALAFETGQRPWDYVADTPITYHIPGSKPYSPRNYDNRFHGRVTLRQALANSYNVPAVKTLVNLGGPSQLINKGQEMGISTWDDRNRFGLSLTLGAGEVLMTDMAEVYGAFATGGYRVELDPFLEIRDAEGQVLYRNHCFNNSSACQQQPVLDPAAAFYVTDILSDNQARAQTFGTFSSLYIPNQQVAVKTGTTNDMRDNWTIGYTSERLVGVWVGNNDNSSMSYVASGVTGASPIWNQVMSLVLSKDQPHQFAVPQGLEKTKICAPTETLPCRNCPRVVEAVYPPGEMPKQACSPHYFVKKEDEPRQDLAKPGERSQIL